MQITKIAFKALTKDVNIDLLSAAIAPFVNYSEYCEHAQTNSFTAAYLLNGDVAPIKDCWPITLEHIPNNIEKLTLNGKLKFFIKHEDADSSNQPSETASFFYRAGIMYHKSEMHKTIHGRYEPMVSTVLLSDSYYRSETYALGSDTVYDYDDEVILSADAVNLTCRDEYAHKNDDDIFYSDIHGYYVTRHSSDVIWCDDVNEYMLESDAYYFEPEGVYYGREENLPSEYRIHNYHCGISPATFLKEGDEVTAQYTVGFEVEKTDIDGYNNGGDPCEEQPLFSHWETDSSCGVEGVTNVYSLNNKTVFTDHVNFSDYCDSPVNSDCGGHINFAHIKNKLEYWHIRPWLGLIYALWRKRLTNSYARRNKKANPYEGRNHHYGVVVEKSYPKRFEIRLPNRVSSKSTLLKRFTLMQALVKCVDLYINEDFSYNQAKYDDTIKGIPNWLTAKSSSFNESFTKEHINSIEFTTFNRTRYFIEQSKDVLLEMYGDTDSLLSVIHYAYAFQAYIDNEQLPENIKTFIGEYL